MSEPDLPKVEVDREFHKNGMWEPEDGYRAWRRAQREIEHGAKPAPIFASVIFEGNGKRYVGR